MLGLVALQVIAILLLFVLIGVATSSEAESKGRDGTLWFFIGFVTGPIGYLVSVVATEKSPPPDAQKKPPAKKKLNVVAERLRKELDAPAPST